MTDYQRDCAANEWAERHLWLPWVFLVVPLLFTWFTH